jgi:hypothetical protein
LPLFLLIFDQAKLCSPPTRCRMYASQLMSVARSQRHHNIFYQLLRTSYANERGTLPWTDAVKSKWWNSPKIM